MEIVTKLQKVVQSNIKKVSIDKGEKDKFVVKKRRKSWSFSWFRGKFIRLIAHPIDIFELVSCSIASPPLS